MGKMVTIAFLSTALTLVGAGCSSSDDAASETVSSGAFPVSIATKFGDVTVESKPQRIVAVGWGDAETALALGVQPVGASDWLAFGGEGVGSWADGLYDSPPEIIATQEPSFEAIAALEPDLILDTKSSGDQDRYNTLSQIAPTIGLPDGSDNYTTSMEDQVTMVAAALGESEKGAALIADIDTKFADAAAAHPEFAGKTITVGAFSGTGYGAYIADSGRVQFMKKLGFVQNPTIDSIPAQGFSVPISREQLNLMDADMIVVFPINNPAAAVTDDELFQRVPAVQAGHALVFSDPEIAKSYSANTVLSLNYALETVVPQVAEKLAG